MNIKIERVALKPRQNRQDFKEYVLNLNKLQIGQSFTYKMNAYHRHAISVIQYLFDKRFITRAEGAGLKRIARIE